jgi:hypothetical protein
MEEKIMGMIDYDYYDELIKPFNDVRHYDEEWEDKDGIKRKFSELDTSHLLNIEKKLRNYNAKIPILLLVELRLRDYKND